MKPIKSFLERYGIHSFLLPIFFILHNYKQYYGLVTGDAAVRVFIKIFLITLAFFLLVRLLLKSSNRGLQIVTMLSFIVLFYGVIKDFFEITLHMPIVAKYSVLLPLITIVAVILIRVIVRKRDFTSSNLFQNLLLLIFIVIDATEIIASNNSHLLQRNLLTKNSHRKIDSLPTPVSKPDVYYIVLDCYPGTLFLKDYMHYDNSWFNDALKEKGFYVLENPKSNYNRTPFSIASTLNFEYLQKIKNFSSANSRDYSQTILTTKESIVPKIFKQYHYPIYNLSIFSIGDTPALFKENFLTMPEETILLYNTLIERSIKDLSWNLIMGKYSIRFFKKMYEKRKEKLFREQKRRRDFNNMVIDSLMKIPFQNSGPKFVYAHMYMPHPPFFYNREGKMNRLDSVLTQESQKDSSLFLSYLEYTNKVVLEIIDSIQTGNSNSLIILQSDHGFTDFEGGPAEPALFFKNYSAFYFPDKNYSALYDTMSNINTFPVIFNKYFETKIPLQKDTTVFLTQ